jgi:hypothetical protein|nr:hypothetical protein [uncultured Emticicia sp.]
MKKILTIYFFILSSIVYCQKTQYAKQYLEVITTQKGVEKKFYAENIIFFNYENKPVIKVYASDGNANFYDRISDELFDSVDGEPCLRAVYKERKDSTKVIVQVFLNKQHDYGCRFVYLNGDIVHFLP